MTRYQYPSSQPHSLLYQAWVDGRQIEVLHTEVADFAAFDCNGPVEITVKAKSINAPAVAVVHPLSRAIEATVDGDSISFHLPQAQNVCLEVAGQIELFIYANPPEESRPLPDDPGVRFYAAGQLHEAGEIILRSGETLYIEAGAVVRGWVRAREASDVCIRGRGVLDASPPTSARVPCTRSIVFEHCERVTVEGIIMIEPLHWMLVLGRCDGVTIRNVKQIGQVISSDGIDICGSRNVLVEGCCLRNNDDNIVVKALQAEGTNLLSWEGDVENVRVRGCVLWNAHSGNAMEIGHELRTGRVRDIVFEDIDVICVHGYGAAFSIHNADRAIVEDIRWENIRVEHYFDKLIDFRVFVSRWGQGAERGKIRNIHLKNIRVVNSIYNPGYSTSVISGFDPASPVENVIVEGLYLNDEPVTNADQLSLHTRNVKDIHFC